MSVTDILDYILLVAIIASAIVGIAKPRAGSFWHKVVHALNYISIFNPRGVKVISWDEYTQLKDKKDANDTN